jgi:ribosomal protein S18 acetylase RimI-like enzyme
MISAVTIRPAIQADVDALGKLGELFVRTHFEADPSRFIAPTPLTSGGYGAFLVSQLGMPDRIVLVAQETRDVVGYAYAGVEGFDYLSLRGPAGVLHDLVVAEGYRGQGIGRTLLGAMVIALQELGAPQVVLSTAERDSSVQRLFDRAGFRRTRVEMTRDF